MLLVRARVVNRMYIRRRRRRYVHVLLMFFLLNSLIISPYACPSPVYHSPGNDDASLQSRCSHVTKDLEPGLAAKLGTAARLINLQRHRRCWARVNPCNTMSAPANNSPPLATPTVDYDLIHSMLKQRCPTLSANHDIHQSTGNT